MYYATNCAQSNHWGESGIFDNSEKKQEKKKMTLKELPLSTARSGGKNMKMSME